MNPTLDVELRTAVLGPILRRETFRSQSAVKTQFHDAPACCMKTLSVKQVEERLGQVKCAVCKSNQFGIDSRSIKEDGEWKAICKSCYYTFPVYTDMEFYLRTQPDVPYRLREISCPKCQNRDFDLDFRIIMSVRESIYFLTCKNCLHHFPERSSLESFE